MKILYVEDNEDNSALAESCGRIPGRRHNDSVMAGENAREFTKTSLQLLTIG